MDIPCWGCQMLAEECCKLCHEEKEWKPVSNMARVEGANAAPQRKQSRYQRSQWLWQWSPMSLHAVQTRPPAIGMAADSWLMPWALCKTQTKNSVSGSQWSGTLSRHRQVCSMHQKSSMCFRECVRNLLVLVFVGLRWLAQWGEEIIHHHAMTAGVPNYLHYLSVRFGFITIIW